ncbi:MAG TPA: hypothetical protein VFI40_07170 [Nocardioides sp.]|nr:hypothetical protein [Nocardioides sp.]
MPVLDNALEAGIVAFVPILFAARFAPFTVDAVRRLTRPVPRGLVPFWAGIALDTMDQRADSVAAVLHGIIFGRIAPSSRQRRRITAPALIVGHTADPDPPVRRLADAGRRAAERRVRAGLDAAGVALLARPAEQDCG